MRGAEGRDELLRRFCKLLGDLHEKRFGFSHGPCDCFCDERRGDIKYWQADGAALEWLEKLVESMPEGHAPIEVTEGWRIEENGDRTYLGAAVLPAKGKGKS